MNCRIKDCPHTVPQDLSTEACWDCGALIGVAHLRGCDIERCTVCNGQRLQCNCKGHDQKKAKFDGFWPGSKEALAKGVCLNHLFGRKNV